MHLLRRVVLEPAPKERLQEPPKRTAKDEFLAVKDPSGSAFDFLEGEDPVKPADGV
jgi:hypothetical protein